jgi:hypothetical protein
MIGRFLVEIKLDTDQSRRKTLELLFQQILSASCKKENSVHIVIGL